MKKNLVEETNSKIPETNLKNIAQTGYVYNFRDFEPCVGKTQIP